MLSGDMANTLAASLIHSRLDYTNSLIHAVLLILVLVLVLAGPVLDKSYSLI